MAEQKDLKQARDVFAALCRSLDQNEWHYKKNEEKLSVECGAQGEDLPIDINIKVDADRMLVMLISPMSFAIKEEERVNVALAVSAVNHVLADGCFDYDVSTGHLFFRMTNSFRESTLSEDVFVYMLYCSCKIIDEYNDKFLMISKGMLSLEQLLTTLAN